jgi:predicted ester cyclase
MLGASRRAILPRMSEPNAAMVREFFATLEDGNIDVLDGILSADYVLHDPSLPAEVRGVEGAKHLIETYRAQFGLRVTIEHQFSDGDYVATRYTARARHDAEFMGIPPTGRESTAAGICISRCYDGRIVEEWEVFDTLSLLRQIGALEQPAAQG